MAPSSEFYTKAQEEMTGKSGDFALFSAARISEDDDPKSHRFGVTISTGEHTLHGVIEITTSFSLPGNGIIEIPIGYDNPQKPISETDPVIAAITELNCQELGIASSGPKNYFRVSRQIGFDPFGKLNYDINNQRGNSQIPQADNVRTLRFDRFTIAPEFWRSELRLEISQGSMSPTDASTISAMGLAEKISELTGWSIQPLTAEEIQEIKDQQIKPTE